MSKREIMVETRNGNIMRVTHNSEAADGTSNESLGLKHSSSQTSIAHLHRETKGLIMYSLELDTDCVSVMTVLWRVLGDVVVRSCCCSLSRWWVSTQPALPSLRSRAPVLPNSQDWMLVKLVFLQSIFFSNYLLRRHMCACMCVCASILM